MVNERIGVLMLNTKFPRLKGDVGNYETFGGRVEYYYVENATSKSVVLSDENLFDAFLHGAIYLEKKGCKLITTSCGFLIKYQTAIASQLTVPFVASSLVIYDILSKLYGSKHVAVLTANKSRLMNMDIKICNIDQICDMCEGMEDSYFYKVYVENKVTELDELDINKLYEDLREKIIKIKEKCDVLSAILLECTNMVPFAEKLSVEFGIPVYTLSSIINWVLKNSKNNYLIG